MSEIRSARFLIDDDRALFWKFSVSPDEFLQPINDRWKVLQPLFQSVIIVSYRNTLHGAVTVIPCSSLDQAGNKWAHKQTTTIDGREHSWAICDKPTTVAVSRLSADRTGVSRVPEEEFDQILGLVFQWLPKIGG